MVETSSEAEIRNGGEKSPLVQGARGSSGRTIYEPDLKSSLKTVYFTAVASFGAVGFGITTVYASPLLDDPHLMNSTKWNQGFSCSSQDLIGPLAPIGATFGAVLSFLFVHLLGLVLPNMLAAIVTALGWLMIGSSQFVMDSPDGFRALLLLGRFVTGFGSGWVAATAPAYIAEMAPAKIRGKLGSLFQLGIGLGTFICYLLGGLIQRYWISAFVFAGLFGLHSLLFFTLEESPQRSRNPIENFKTLASSCQFRSSEPRYIDIAGESESSPGIRSSIFQWPYVWRILVIMAVMVLQRLSGISAIVYYVGPILKSAGWTSTTFTPDTAAALAIGVVLTLSTLLSVFFVDKMGRRIMLFFGSLGMALANIGLGVFFLWPHTAHNGTVQSTDNRCFHPPPVVGYSSGLQALPLVCISLYCVAYAVSWGPVSWILSGEIFPKRIREVGCAIGSATNWLSTAIITYLFPMLSRNVNNGVTFLILAAICLLSIIFVILFLPETRGLTLDQNANLKFSIRKNVEEFFAIIKWFCLCGCFKVKVDEKDSYVQSM